MEQTQSASALVVRNIGEIEAALAHAEKIGSILWEAVEAALRGRLELNRAGFAGGCLV